MYTILAHVTQIESTSVYLKGAIGVEEVHVGVELEAHDVERLAALHGLEAHVLHVLVELLPEHPSRVLRRARNVVQLLHAGIRTDEYTVPEIVI